MSYYLENHPLGADTVVFRLDQCGHFFRQHQTFENRKVNFSSAIQASECFVFVTALGGLFSFSSRVVSPRKSKPTYVEISATITQSTTIFVEESH